MKRCRIGDLAMVVGGVHLENLGKTVRVVAAAEELWSNECDWFCVSLSGPLCGEDVFGIPMSGTEGNVADAHLMPLRPDSIQEHEGEMERAG